MIAKRDPAGWPIKFMGSFEEIGDLPNHPTIREFAFVGRSNVGKSSLINAIVGEKAAKVSNEPGRTRSMNLFNWGDRVWLMDLPGYGYARVSKDDRARWLDRLENYLARRRELKALFILIDSRRGIMESDGIMIDFCEAEKIPYRIIYTKCDKKEARGAKHASPGIMTSALKKIGIGEVSEIIFGGMDRGALK
jgi:GTP-binding protein